MMIMKTIIMIKLINYKIKIKAKKWESESKEVNYQKNYKLSKRKIIKTIKTIKIIDIFE